MASLSPWRGRARRWLVPDGLVLAALAVFLLAMFWPVTIGGRSLVPFDALYQSLPWSAFAAEHGVTGVQNPLVTDLLLENYTWKSFITREIAARELPLWNPYLFAGAPFLAAGQSSALYPLSVLYYGLPLWLAYGWFTAVQIWLAGAFTYAYARRGLRLAWAPSAAAMFVFALSQLFLVNPVHPMIIAGMAWLPLILLALERVFERDRRGEGLTIGLTAWLAVGAGAIGCVFLAGHVEIALYTLLVAAYYGAARLVAAFFQRGPDRARSLAKGAGAMGAMAVLGVGLASVQILPLYELVSQNFRQAAASLAEVRGYAFPARHVLAFVMPDIFGNPAHHGYFDIFQNAWVSELRNRAGASVDNTAWGIKNYVEGAVYAGLLPLLLAVVAIWDAVSSLTPRPPLPQGERGGALGEEPALAPSPTRGEGGRATYTWIFALLALASLLFMFGTPAYALLYILPGFSQLHTPFRWVYPYTFSLAMLAALGWAAIPRHRRLTTGLGAVAAVLGALGLLALGVGYVMRARLVPLAEIAVDRLAKASDVFGAGQAFLSYEGRSLLLFAVFLTLTGLALVWLARSIPHPPAPSPTRGEGEEMTPDSGSKPLTQPLPEGEGQEKASQDVTSPPPVDGGRRRGGFGLPWPSIAALAVLAADLFVASYGFNPAVDPKLANFTPPAVTFLQERRAQEGPFRITVLGDKSILAPNLPMLYGLEDTRGYDSIILRDYVDFSRLIGDQDLLLFNQVAPLRKTDALDSPLLDVLGVRYVVTNKAIERPGWTLAYDGEVKIYRNEDAKPRAFFASDAPGGIRYPLAGEPRGVYRMLSTVDPRQVVVLDPTGMEDDALPPPPADLPRTASAAANRIAIRRYTPSTVEMDVSRAGQGGLLVLADSFFGGWQAHLAPADDPSNETDVPILRVDGIFRGVPIPPGTWHLRLVYSPMSFKLGLYLSFLSFAILGFLFGFAAWRRVYGVGHEADTVRRVGRNSLAPMLTTLSNKAVDFAFAALMLRILGPASAGAYYFAIAIVGYLEIWSNFGLNLYLTRHVAQHRDEAESTLAETMGLRMVLLGLAVPVLLLLGAVWFNFFDLNLETALTIGLLVIALIPGNIAGALSSLFYAEERMEYPAGLTSLTTLIKVSLGALVLLLGWGIVGLAGVAIVSNVVTVGILWRAASRLFFRPGITFAPAAAWGIVVLSYPLMLNHLLNTLFFKVDVTLLQPLQGDTVVGYYSTAYKWIDALLIIPAYFTLAIFPLMSRYASETPKGDGVARHDTPLARAYVLAIRLLLMIALPAAALMFFSADVLVGLLGGAAYLPYGAIALRIMIWFLPFSFVNGVTQYVLVAVDEAKWITRSFLIAVVFNVVANLIFIPRYSYVAAAVITVLSEIVLMVPFMIAVRRSVAPVNLLRVSWRPIVATAALVGVTALVWGRLPFLVALTAGGLTYLVVLATVGGITAEDRRLARRLLPKRPVVVEEVQGAEVL
ncbi:MAG: oligosaccharide flippase family protein [Anaerolineae bacterium]